MVPVSCCCSNSIFQVAVGRRLGIFFRKFCLLKFTNTLLQVDREKSNPKAFLYFTKPWALPGAPRINHRFNIDQDHVRRAAIDGHQIHGAATGSGNFDL